MEQLNNLDRPIKYTGEQRAFDVVSGQLNNLDIPIKYSEEQRVFDVVLGTIKQSRQTITVHWRTVCVWCCSWNN